MNTNSAGVDVLRREVSMTPAFDKRANRSEYELAWVRNAHRSAVARFIGKAVQA
jgi:hypothetical protein